MINLAFILTNLFLIILSTLFTIFYLFIQKKYEKILLKDDINAKDSNLLVLFIIIQSIIVTLLFQIILMISISSKVFINNYLEHFSEFESYKIYIFTVISSMIGIFPLYIILKKEKELIKVLLFKETLNFKNFLYFIIFLLPIFIIKILVPLMINKSIKLPIYITNLLHYNKTNNLIVALMMTIFNVFIEEIIFRFYIQYKFKKVYNKFTSEFSKNYDIYLSSLLFSIFHIIHYRSKVIFLFPIFFIFSLYLFLVKKYCKSIVYCTLAHFIRNILTVV
jgi:hypothetical protein